jgi:hypothetical protein
MGERGNLTKQVIEYVQCDSTVTFAVLLCQNWRLLDKAQNAQFSLQPVLKILHSDKQVELGDAHRNM